MNENEIRMLICKSQEDGFRTLFQEYQRYVYTIVWDKIKSLGTAEDAEECVSDIFAEVFIHFDDINEGSLKGYIGTIAKRTAIHRYRTLRAKSGYIADSDEFPDIPDEVDIQKEFEEKEYYKKLYQCILSLGEPDSSIIASPIKPCQKDESRKEIYQGRKMQECCRISSFSDAEKFALCRAFDGKV